MGPAENFPASPQIIIITSFCTTKPGSLQSVIEFFLPSFKKENTQKSNMLYIMVYYSTAYKEIVPISKDFSEKLSARSRICKQVFSRNVFCTGERDF